MVNKSSVNFFITKVTKKNSVTCKWFLLLKTDYYITCEKEKQKHRSTVEILEILLDLHQHLARLAWLYSYKFYLYQNVKYR